MRAADDIAERLLVVDDDPFVRGSLAALLETEGYDVVQAASGEEGAEAFETSRPDMVVTDLNLPGISGMELLAQIRVHERAVPVVLITGYGSIEQAVAAIKAGAYDFVSKPIVDDELRVVIRRGFEERSLRRENQQLRKRLDLRYSFSGILGHDHRMQRIFETVESVAPTRSNVVVTGESGTGKTLLARAIHHNSPRRDGPYVEVNCGALPESLLESELFGHVKGSFTGAHADRAGRFELADGGTLFLDEIHDASPALQAKLLRVLQDREFEPVGGVETRKVDVRMVLATNKDLEHEVAEGRFRQDLYYRIHVVSLHMPPLRERLGDLPGLAEHFLRAHAEENNKPIEGIGEAALAALMRHDWPGNVRELENCIERAVVLCKSSRIGVEDLPAPLQGDDVGGVRVPVGNEVLPLRVALEGPERAIIEHALRTNDGNRQKTAAALDINRTTLFNKMRKYGLMERY